jgi:hypothetical protein
MGYYYKVERENAVSLNSGANPKTHVPGSRLQKRGLRFYSPGNMGWTYRDPILKRIEDRFSGSGIGVRL